MSAHGKGGPEVNRLLDIVVEEVSLVDRAANKHRFLIVKRSNDMADDNTTEHHDRPSRRRPLRPRRSSTTELGARRRARRRSRA
jgi:hypothetical protein